MKGRQEKRLRFSVIIFFIGLLFTFRLWDFYFNSNYPIDNILAANLVLVMGTLFSLASGLFVWSLEARRHFLECEVDKISYELSHHLIENRRSDAAMNGIYICAQTLHSQNELSVILKSVLDMMYKIFRADEGSILLIGEDEKLYIAASTSLSEEVAKTVRIGLGERVAGRAAQLQKKFLIVDGLENHKEFRGIESNPLIRSSIVCPLLFRTELLGVINMNRTFLQHNFTVTDLMNVSILADLVSSMIHNIKLGSSLNEKISQLEAAKVRLKTLES